MKKLLMIGVLVLSLLQLLTSCCIDPLEPEVPDTGNLYDYNDSLIRSKVLECDKAQGRVVQEHLHKQAKSFSGIPDTYYKSFGNKVIATKGDPIYFTWENGMQVCVYSLDADGKVMFKDTCVVKNASGSGSSSKAQIEAEVAKEAVTYFACYPFNILDAEVGEVMNYDYKETGCGKLKDVAILVATEAAKNSKDSSTGSFKFYPKNSILFVGNTLDINGGTGTSWTLYDLYITMYTKEYPDGKSITVPRSYNYSNSNPYYIHVSTQDLGTGTAKNGVAVKLRGYCEVGASKYYFWQCEKAIESAFKDRGKCMTIDHLPAGKYKQVLPSKYVHNDDDD